MTFEFIALKNPRAGSSLEKHFKVFVFLVLPFGMFNTVVVFRENKLAYGLCLAWKVLK